MVRIKRFTKIILLFRDINREIIYPHDRTFKTIIGSTSFRKLNNEIVLMQNKYCDNIFDSETATMQYILNRVDEKDIIDIFKVKGFVAEQLETQRFCFRFSSEELFSLQLRKFDEIVSLDIV